MDELFLAVFQRGCPGTAEELASTVWPQLLAAVSVNGWTIPPDA
jgi:hypothetical protein